MVGGVEDQFDLGSDEDPDLDLALLGIGWDRSTFNATGLALGVFGIAGERDSFPCGKPGKGIFGKIDGQVAMFVVEKIGENLGGIGPPKRQSVANQGWQRKRHNPDID